jgi:hypothetical protein
LIEIFQDQELFLSRFAEVPGIPLALGPAQFMRMQPEELSQLAFLDASELHKPIELELPLAEFIRQACNVHAQHAFGMIYHSAFCCSTYLARCLEVVGIGQSLKEPYALTQLAFYQADDTYQQFAKASEWDDVLRGSLDFLTHPRVENAFSLIKSHNFCIALAPDIARLFAGRVRSVFIYSDLHSFLVSTLKSPARRDFVRLLLKLLGAEKVELLGMPLLDPSALDDGEAAAYCWLMHMGYYDFAAQQYGDSAFCSLNCDALLQRPTDTIAALAGFWGQPPLEHEQITQRLNDGALQSHAKEKGRAFSAQQRLTDLQTHGFRHRKEIKRTLQWFDGLDLRDGLRAKPRNPLL